MLTIKTDSMTVTREKNDLLSAAYSMNTIYLKFYDHIELHIPAAHMETNMMNTVMTMLKTSKCKKILFDLTNPSQLISFEED